MKQVIVWISLSVLILSSINMASATYYYTDEYFKEAFGETNLYSDEDPLTKNNMMILLVDLEKEEYEITLEEETVVEELLIDPEEEPVVEESFVVETDVVFSFVGDEVNDTSEINTTPVEETPTEEITLDDNLSLLIRPIEDEPGNDSGLIVTSSDSGVLLADDSGDVPLEEETSDEENFTSDLVMTPAVVADEEGIPFQLVIIAFLIVVIVIMLAVLLTKGEEKAEEQWEEGEFFNSKSKKATKTDTKKKLSTIKKEVKKTPKLKPAPKAKPKKKGDVKPFLLKIKDEV